MRRFVTVFTLLLFAVAGIAFAGDNIKWKRSRKLKVVPPANSFDEFGSDVERMESKYMLDWTPYSNRNIDFILATYYGWETLAVVANNETRKGLLTKEDLPAAEKTAREDFGAYVLFFVKIRFNNGEFYETSGEDFWSFYCITGDGKTEPIRIEKKSYKQPINVVIGIGSPSYNPYGPDLRWYREYKVYFDKAALGEEPNPRKLVVTGDDTKRGFEWRFKED